MADRIVVLNAGEIEQIGSPLELYNRPGNVFVAGFLGSPRMNFFKARPPPAATDAVASSLAVEARSLPLRCRSRRDAAPPPPGAAVLVGVRPESLRVGRRRRRTVDATVEGGREPRPRDAALRRRRAARRRPIRNRSEGYIAVHAAAQATPPTAIADPRSPSTARDVFLFDAGGPTIRYPEPAARQADLNHPEHKARASMRYRQIHLDFHTSERIPGIGSRFDAQGLRPGPSRRPTSIRVTVFSKCHHGWSYHPTKVGKQHPQSGLRPAARADRRAARRGHQRAGLSLRRLGRACRARASRAGASSRRKAC